MGRGECAGNVYTFQLHQLHDSADAARREWMAICTLFIPMIMEIELRQDNDHGRKSEQRTFEIFFVGAGSI